MKRIFYAASVAIGLATVVALRAFNPQPDPPKVFGMVGITLGETGRLNVVVPGTSTPGSTAPPACRVVFGFLNAEGQIVKQEVKAILPGHAASLELTGVEAFLPPGPIRSLRADIRPVAELAAMQPSTVSCQMVSTFEVFDNATGRTSLLSQQPPVNDQPAAGN